MSMIIYSLKDSNIPYITLSDFDLSNEEISRELLDHIGNEFDSVIKKDIVAEDSGSSIVDKEIGDTFRGLRLGTRASTSIFMSSFSGAEHAGINMGEIKRSVAFQDIPSSLIDNVVNLLKKSLFHLQSKDELFYFSNKPNLNRIKQNKIDSIKQEEILSQEKDILESVIGKQDLQVKLWPKYPKDIEDSSQLKLVILQNNDRELRNSILKNKTENEIRVFKNSIFFLCPVEQEKSQFIISLKSKIALEKIISDPLLSIDKKEREHIKNEIERETKQLKSAIRKYYRSLYYPNQNGLESLDLGIPTIGDNKGIDDEVYDRLVSAQQIHVSLIGGLVLKNEYLKNDNFSKTENMYESLLSAPGSRFRPLNRNIIIMSLQKAVLDGTFGLGELVDGKPITKYFKTEPTITFEENEVIIKDSICIDQIKPDGNESTPNSEESIENKPEMQHEISEEILNQLEFGIQIPEGKLSEILGILRLINNKFSSIELNIRAKNGEITKKDIETIKDALKETNAFSNL